VNLFKSCFSVFFLLLPGAVVAQFPEHMYPGGDPMNFSDTATLVICVFIPIAVAVVWILFRKHRKINLRVDSCGTNKAVHRKELKYLASNRNFEPGRKTLAREEVFEN